MCLNLSPDFVYFQYRAASTLKLPMAFAYLNELDHDGPAQSVQFAAVTAAWIMCRFGLDADWCPMVDAPMEARRPIVLWSRRPIRGRGAAIVPVVPRLRRRRAEHAWRLPVEDGRAVRGVAAGPRGGRPLSAPPHERVGVRGAVLAIKPVHGVRPVSVRGVPFVRRFVRSRFLRMYPDPHEDKGHKRV